MALFLTAGTTGFDGPTVKDAVDLHLIGLRGPYITSSTPQVGINFSIGAALPGVSIGGRNFADFPPTPAAPAPWILGCIQNVIRHRVTVTWFNGTAEVVEQLTLTTPMLDADQQRPGEPLHLPYVRIASSVGMPTTMGILYGRPGRPVGIPVTLTGPGPAWDQAGMAPPFDLIDEDGPGLSVLNFKGGGASNSPNPVVEVARSITLQAWVTAVAAVPMTNLSDASKHFILGYTDEFTLTSKYNRRAGARGGPSDAGWYDFVLADFQATPSQLALHRNIGNLTPPPRRPVVSGPLSKEPVIAWLKQKGFAPF